MRPRLAVHLAVVNQQFVTLLQILQGHYGHLPAVLEPEAYVCLARVVDQARHVVYSRAERGTDGVKM